jgi:hypothetical protein
MKIRLRLLLRALLLLAVWGAATYALCCSVHHLTEHRQLAADVTSLDADYNRRVSDYAGLLVEGHKISNDPDYQVRLLKQRFGYARPNETPIVVQIETGH